MILRSENIDLLILINIFYQKIQEMLYNAFRDEIIIDPSLLEKD